MTIGRLILLLVSIAAIAILTACGSSSSSPPPPPQITVSFQTAPPSSLFVATTTAVTAVVANDSSNAGVDWTVTCGSPGACGSFSPTHTASGTATTYTAPAVVPAGSTVTIKAASTANTAKSVSANITITDITVSFQTVPPSSLAPSASTSVTAVVANDASNAGVDWTVTCGSPGACGSFSPTHTASGTATTYTAPAVAPAGNTVTITAASTAKPAKSVSATIAILNFSNSSLNGSYVFEVLGTDNTFLPYQLAGVLTADGNGNITGGELTYSNQNVLVINAPITASTYSFGADGRGTINLITPDSSIGVLCGANDCLTLEAVLVSSSRALITQFDTSATSSGTMDLQTAVAAPTGGYAFVVNGADFLTPNAMAIGGVFNINSPGTISGAGSVADIDEGGTIANSVTVTGTVFAPDKFGAVTVDLTIDGTPDQFIGYIVDAKHIKLVESDGAFGSTAGQAIGQGAATGTFLDDTAFSGTFVYGISGQSIFGTAAFAAVFTADGAGNLTNGVTDESLGVNVISDTLTGIYAVDSSGTGRAAATTTFGINGAGPALIFYLTGNGNPPLVLNADSPLGSPLSLGAGIALPQATGPFSFNGPYGMNFTANDTSGNESDGTAQVTADAPSGTFTGTLDINIEDFFNSVFTPTPDVPLSGAFTSSSNGRFPGTLTTNTPTVSTAIYVVDATQGFIIETDSQQVAIGPFITQQ